MQSVFSDELGRPSGAGTLVASSLPRATQHSRAHSLLCHLHRGAGAFSDRAAVCKPDCICVWKNADRNCQKSLFLGIVPSTFPSAAVSPLPHPSSDLTNSWRLAGLRGPKPCTFPLQMSLFMSQHIRPSSPCRERSVQILCLVPLFLCEYTSRWSVTGLQRV